MIKRPYDVSSKTFVFKGKWVISLCFKKIKKDKSTPAQLSNKL
jgi:hypothetical protein